MDTNLQQFAFKIKWFLLVWEDDRKIFISFNFKILISMIAPPMETIRNNAALVIPSLLGKWNKHSRTQIRVEVHCYKNEALQKQYTINYCLEFTRGITIKLSTTCQATYCIKIISICRYIYPYMIWFYLLTIQGIEPWVQYDLSIWPLRKKHI